MSERTYRAAVIGLGFVGAGDEDAAEFLGQPVEGLQGSVHAVAMAHHPRLQLVAGSTRDAGRRQRFAARFPGVATYADFREMLAAEVLDVVGVASNTPAHAELTIACAEAGVRCVFCEKPIATRLRDADRMIEACRAHGTLLVMNHNRRWHPLFGEARDRLAAGEIGALNHLLVRWPSGRLGNVGTHLFDVLHRVLGEYACAVSGTLDTTGAPDCRGPQYRDPGGWGVIAYPSGLRGFVEASETAPAEMGILVQITGSLGEMTLTGAGGSIRLWSGETQELAAVPDGWVTMEHALDEIAACLDGTATTTSSGEDGRATLEIITGFHVSDRARGRWAQLPLQGTDRGIEIHIG
jgi:predicted dehydrogenase